MVSMRKIVFDQNKCSGCRLCEVVCSEFHEEEINPALSRIIIVKNEEIGEDRPVICEQCDNAPCSAACPVDAISYNVKTGAWIVDKETCTGCGFCVDACPFNAIHLHPKRGVAYKCDYCGVDPQCVRVCELSALHWLPIHNT